MANDKGHILFSQNRKRVRDKISAKYSETCIKVLKRSPLRNGLLTTYLKTLDDSLTNLRVTQENRNMVKETNIYPTAN